MNIFDIGNIVRLKSNGHEMTVSAFLNDDIVCVWYDENGDSSAGVFNSQDLDLLFTESQTINIGDPNSDFTL